MMEGVTAESGDRPISEQNGDMNVDDQEQPKTNGDVNGFGHGTNHVDSITNDVKKEHKHSGEHKHHSSSKHKSSHSDKHRHSSSHKSSHSDKQRSSSDKSKHHSSSSSDKHKSSSSSKDKDKDRHHSSSSHKDKHSSSSSSKHHSSSHKDKTHSSSSKVSSSSGEKSKHHGDEKSKHHGEEKSKHHSDKHRHSSSDKHKHSSSDKSKHDKERHSSDKHKHSSSDKHMKSEVKMETDEKVPVKAEPVTPVKVVKQEPQPMEESDDDMPLSIRTEAIKKEVKPKVEKMSAGYDSDDEPLAARVEKVNQKVPKRKSMEEDDDYKPEAKKKKKEEKKKKVKVEKGKVQKQEVTSPKKGGKVKKEETQEKWKWWEEASQKKEDGIKWNFLEHKGVVFAALYERLPSDVHFHYNGKQLKLSDDAEEVAGFYAKMLDHDYTTRDVFNKNFFKDWRSVMTKNEKEVITDLSKCNFKELYRYFKEKQEERKSMSKDEKKKIKEQNEAIMKEFGYCSMDGHTEKMGNFRIEPPGLFRGRGDHPKQGCLKRRVQAEDIIINCSRDSKIPEAPPGHRWKKVQHDNSVTWLASWQENVQNQIKYVMLAATSKLKGEKDWSKYETARKLHKIADRIRAQYREDWKSKEMRLRQRSVALYFIDKLALRAGNEKDEDSADTVGCCSLRYEHLKLHEEKDGKENVVEFDFLGKDSIRYHNEVSVEKRVFKNLQLFMENKSDGDDLFDRLNTTIMNKHLNTLMDGLTAKVFRTYNASRTLQEQLDLLTNAEDPIPAKILAYNRANRAVAVLCNHQRAVSKNFGKQMENMQNKITAKKEAIQDAKTELKQAKSDYKALKTEAKRKLVERKKKAVERLEDQLEKLEISMTDKDENKEIALGTSKLNYLDPRISVAWCKKWEVPLEKVYNKTQRDKFAWAIDMAEEDYKFTELDDNGSD